MQVVSHVFDLPQIYTRPSVERLRAALISLALGPPAWNASEGQGPRDQLDGLPRYLTTIIASSLEWLDEDEREEIWTLASKRQSERAGRSAMPSMKRFFHIPVSGDANVDICLSEPSMTGDDLGLKTWGASFYCSRGLYDLASLGLGPGKRVLELGAGTGLVGISAAIVWKSQVVLTDLPEILKNLSENIRENEGIIQEAGGSAEAQVLDWKDATSADPLDTFDIICAADPLYSKEHPRLLTDTIRRKLKWQPSSRLLIELPIRNAYLPQIKELRTLLRKDLTLLDSFHEEGVDDWEGKNLDNDKRAQVSYWRGIWAPTLSGEDVFDALRGKWQVDRTINCAPKWASQSGGFTGSACFSPRVSEDHTDVKEYLYNEEGVFKSHNNPAFSYFASRKYGYRLGVSASDRINEPSLTTSTEIEVWFIKPQGDDDEVDYLFHTLNLIEFPADEALQRGQDIHIGDDMRLMKANTYHLCGNDRYEIEYSLYLSKADDALVKFQIEYTVSGPNKQYISSSWYSRKEPTIDVGGFSNDHPDHQIV